MCIRDSYNSSYICLLTETFRYGSKQACLPKNCSVVPSPGTVEDCRASIMSNLDITEISSLAHRDAAVATIEVEGGSYLLVSLYMDIQERIDQDFMNNILAYANERNMSLVIGADSNCHTTLTGPTANKRGLDLEELLIEQGLMVKNIGTVPTFETFRGDNHIQTCIDITLSRAMDGKIKNWRVDQEYNGSDHNTILFTLDISPPRSKAVRNWNSCVWSQLTAEMSLCNFYEPELVTEKKLDRCIYQLYLKLNRALDKICPKKVKKTKVRANSWYNKDLKRMAGRIKKAYRTSMRILGEAKAYYKRLVKKYRKMCKKRKASSWKYYKETRQTVNDMVKLTNIIQKKRRNKINTFIKDDGGSTNPGQETLDTLINTHFPQATEKIKKKYSSQNSFSRSYILSKNEDWISIDLIREAMAIFQSKKSPGPDGIKPIIFEYLPEKFLNHLAFIYKSMILLRYTPIKWKETKVIFIPKPGKKSYNIPKAFRPISLSNYFLKTLERLICWKVEEELKASPLHKAQHGLTSNKSTKSAASHVVNYVEKHMFNKQHCIGEIRVRHL